MEHQVAVIGSNWGSVCGEAELGDADPRLLWRRHFPNDLAFEGLEDRFAGVVQNPSGASMAQLGRACTGAGLGTIGGKQWNNSGEPVQDMAPIRGAGALAVNMQVDRKPLGRREWPPDTGSSRRAPAELVHCRRRIPVSQTDTPIVDFSSQRNPRRFGCP